MVEDFIAPLIADSISHGSTSHNIANTQISIRHARQEDLLEILQIERLSCPSPWTFDIFNHFLGTPGFLVATTPSENSSVGDILPISNTHPSPIGFIIADVILEDNLPLGHISPLAQKRSWNFSTIPNFTRF